MQNKLKPQQNQLFLGIDGGGSNTVAVIADANGNLVKRFETGPCNLKLLNDAQLGAVFSSVADALPTPYSIGIGLAGARLPKDIERIQRAAGRVWKNVPCVATNDLEIALHSSGESKQIDPSLVRVLVLSGTGSCAYGKKGSETKARTGGWGHLLGDQGSGYDIALSALRQTIFEFDQSEKWPLLGSMLLNKLAVNQPDDLIPWIHCCLKMANRKNPAHFILAGSLLQKQPEFAKLVSLNIRKTIPHSTFQILSREAAWGAVHMAQTIPSALESLRKQESPAKTEPKLGKAPKLAAATGLKGFGAVSPTEQRNPLSLNLDRLPISKAIELMLSQEEKVPAAILKERKKITLAVELISQAMKKGGRLIYAGAGTSGRLGVLDASECPPTFRTDPNLVQGIMAGGYEALWSSIEGAEDSMELGAQAIHFRSVTSKDVVVGIAASGRTPFVWGALNEAKRQKASTILLAFNPFVQIPKNGRPDIVITPNLGPEVLTGSTRLKSGTATKLILNIFTTLAMVQNGKVISNLMVDMNPSNEKLMDRAVRMLCELHPSSPEDAQAALEASGWVIKKALARLEKRR